MNKSGSGNRLSTFLFADEMNDLLESRVTSWQALIIKWENVTSWRY